MDIDFNQQIIGFDGVPFKEKVEEGEEEKPLTLRTVCVSALLSGLPLGKVTPNQNVNLSGEEQVKRYDLAMVIYKNTRSNFESEEIVKIKELITKTFKKTILVGQAHKMLENKNGN